jgi:alpha-D-ribose 1-methylphosphonate 5-triphosphate synthase subunit PhnG
VSVPTRIEYAVGLRFPEGADTTAYDFLVGLPDYEPEKHELWAHLLLVAVRMEWDRARVLRELRADQEKRERRRAERAAAKQSGGG